MGRIKNALADYWSRKNKNKGAFFVNDFTELFEMSKNDYELMCNSLNAGFIIGYRTAKRELKANHGSRAERKGADNGKKQKIQ